MMQYTTDRLVLRTLTPDDSNLLSDYLDRNRDFLRKWEPLRDMSYYSSDSVKTMIMNEIGMLENGTGLSLYIFIRNDEKIIGNVSITNIIYGVFQSCYLGYKLDKDEINKGIITEALNKLIEIAFAEYSLHRIEANIMPRNSRSIRVIQKLGFTEEGLSRKYLKINGKWEDHIHFALLNEAGGK